MAHEFPGHYARIEGPDGAGKTTQLELAKQFSQDHNLDTLFVREPGGTPLGVEIRHMLLTNTEHSLDPITEMLLFTADRNHLIDTEIRPALEAGQPVIGDRGIESTTVYQPAGDGISVEMIEAISSQVLPEWYMYPDAVALLSISRAVREKRMLDRYKVESADKMEARDHAFFDRVFEGYKQLEKKPHVTLINADPDPEEVFEHLKPVIFGKFLPRDTHKKILY